MSTTADTLTLEAYAALEEPDDRKVSELVRGRLVREPRPGAPHARCQFRLAHHLTAWTEAAGRGEVYGESGFILSDDPPTVRGPDVAVVLRPHGWEGEPGQWIRGAPELAVEVLSPSDTSSATQEKVLDYLGAGARAVWIVDPGARTVMVYRPDRSATLVEAGDTLTGEDLLPGFNLALSTLFDDTRSSEQGRGRRATPPPSGG